MGSRNQNQVLLITWQALYWLSHFSSPMKSFLTLSMSLHGFRIPWRLVCHIPYPKAWQPSICRPQADKFSKSTGCDLFVSVLMSSVRLGSEKYLSWGCLQRPSVLTDTVRVCTSALLHEFRPHSSPEANLDGPLSLPQPCPCPELLLSLHCGWETEYG